MRELKFSVKWHGVTNYKEALRKGLEGIVGELKEDSHYISLDLGARKGAEFDESPGLLLYGYAQVWDGGEEEEVVLKGADLVGVSVYFNEMDTKVVRFRSPVCASWETVEDKEYLYLTIGIKDSDGFLMHLKGAEGFRVSVEFAGQIRKDFFGCKMVKYQSGISKDDMVMEASFAFECDAASILEKLGCIWFDEKDMPKE